MASRVAPISTYQPNGVARRGAQLPLWAHQVEALNFYRKGRHLANLSGYGTGKTPSAVARMADLVPPHRALVVSTGAMIGSPHNAGAWTRNLRVFGRPEWKLAYLTGDRERRWRELERPHHIALATYETVLILGEALKGRYDVLVLDEVHRLKDPTSLMSRAWAALARSMDTVIGLTGSPILESPLDLYGVFRAINPYLWEEDFYSWRDRYFTFTSTYDEEGERMFPKWHPRDGALDILRSMVMSMSIRVAQEDLPFDWPQADDRPPVLVDLAPSVRTVYDRVAERFDMMLSSGPVDVKNIRPRLQKLCQLTAGWCYDQHHQPLTVGPSTKAAALADLFDQHAREGPFLVWAVTAPDMALAKKALERFGGRARVDAVYGKVTPARRQKMIDRFNHGLSNVLIAHPRCLGEGVDLSARHDVRLSRTWSALQWTQSRGRARRLTTSHHKVGYWEIVARDTVDEAIVDSLAAKTSMLRLLLKARSLEGALTLARRKRSQPPRRTLTLVPRPPAASATPHA